MSYLRVAFLWWLPQTSPPSRWRFSPSKTTSTWAFTGLDSSCCRTTSLQGQIEKGVRASLIMWPPLPVDACTILSGLLRTLVPLVECGTGEVTNMWLLNLNCPDSSVF